MEKEANSPLLNQMEKVHDTERLVLLGDKTVPINSFFPFLFCSILNKKIMEDVSFPHLSLSTSRRERVRCFLKIHHRLSFPMA